MHIFITGEMCLFEHEVVCRTNNVKLAFLLELKYCSGLLPHSTKHRLLLGIIFIAALQVLFYSWIRKSCCEVKTLFTLKYLKPLEKGFKPCSAAAEYGRIYIIVKVMDFTLNSKQTRGLPEITQQNFLQVYYTSLYEPDSVLIRPSMVRNGHLIYVVLGAPRNSSVDKFIS